MAGRRRVAVLSTLGLLTLAVLVFYLSGFPDDDSETPGKVQHFEAEPRISLFVKQTGERTELPIEEYVAGVVAGEMWENWPESAYAAQAILARTFTLEMISRGGTRSLHGTDMSTDPVEAQAYNPSNITPVIRRAVDSTRGQVIAYNGQYAKAWFHSYSGGRTATPQEGLDIPNSEAPYLRSVTLPSNSLVPSEFRSWRAEFSGEQVRAALAQRGVSVGSIRDVQVASRGPTGRITSVTVIGSDGKRELSGNDLRVALGPEKMRSTLVRTFTFDKDRLVVEGTGSGHGVGLSQWDALLLARQGKSPRQIVETFFPDARIEKLW